MMSAGDSLDFYGQQWATLISAYPILVSMPSMLLLSPADLVCLVSHICWHKHIQISFCFQNPVFLLLKCQCCFLEYHLRLGIGSISVQISFAVKCPLTSGHGRTTSLLCNIAIFLLVKPQKVHWLAGWFFELPSLRRPCRRGHEHRPWSLAHFGHFDRSGEFMSHHGSIWETPLKMVVKWG